MEFDYRSFIKDLKNNPEKKKIIEQYESYCDDQSDIDIHETEFFEDYLSSFEFDDILITIPSGVLSEFDWDLFIRLVFASYSSFYRFDIEESWKENPQEKVKVSLNIVIPGKEGPEITSIDKLETWQFTILLKINVLEQISHFVYMKENENRTGYANGLAIERKIALKRLNNHLQDIANKAKLFKHLSTNILQTEQSIQ
ncbi:MAG TPA: hypothetical protein GXZ87_09155 [Bacteroidales bacterium]|nr:hypothetical protein [Bacteroidales bacterium]